jgi:hypothetical protein
LTRLGELLREIARRCAVHHVFVGKVRRELSGDDHQIDRPARKAKRGGKTYRPEILTEARPGETRSWQMRNMFRI